MPHLQKWCMFRTEDLPGLIQTTHHSHVRVQGVCALAVGGAMLFRADTHGNCVGSARGDQGETWHKKEISTACGRGRFAMRQHESVPVRTTGAGEDYAGHRRYASVWRLRR